MTARKLKLSLCKIPGGGKNREAGGKTRLMISMWKVLSILLPLPLAFLGLSEQQKETESKLHKKVSRMPFTGIVDHAQHSVAAIVRQTPQGIGMPIGSSFFVNQDGYLVTNAHVIREAEAIKSQGVPVALYQIGRASCRERV